MNIEQIRQLFQTHQISPNKLMGQNFMVKTSLYPKLSTYAELREADVVLDAGAGFGWLTCFLADKCRSVVAVEKDFKIAKALREQVKGLNNVTVIEGDVLKTQLPKFNKLLAIPPYYLSSHLVTWILEQKVDCAVLILQKEFAERLVAPAGREEYGWLTVVTSLCFEAELFDAVSKEMFYPQPEVDSIILRLKPLKKKPFEVIDTIFFLQMMKWLFTQRNKKLGKALAPFIRDSLKLSKQDAGKLAQSLQFHDRRVRELLPKDFGAIANALCQ